MDLEETKYTRVEYERRFLVSPQADWRSQPPSFVSREVTEDPFFMGGNLCQTTRTELVRKLASFK